MSIRLQIPGCGGDTYTQCFRKLGSASGFVAVDTSQVLFAPITFRTPVDDTDTVTIELDPAVWPAEGGGAGPKRPVTRYRVSIGIGRLGEPGRKRFRHERQKEIDTERRDHEDHAREHGRDRHRRHPRTWRTYLFFVGTQDPDDPATCIVDDHRLTSVQRLGRTVYEQL